MMQTQWDQQVSTQLLTLWTRHADAAAEPVALPLQEQCIRYLCTGPDSCKQPWLCRDRSFLSLPLLLPVILRGTKQAKRTKKTQQAARSAVQLELRHHRKATSPRIIYHQLQTAAMRLQALSLKAAARQAEARRRLCQRLVQPMRQARCHEPRRRGRRPSPATAAGGLVATRETPQACCTSLMRIMRAHWAG
jgi:hypothetical protein